GRGIPGAGGGGEGRAARDGGRPGRLARQRVARDPGGRRRPGPLQPGPAATEQAVPAGRRGAGDDGDRRPRRGAGERAGGRGGGRGGCSVRATATCSRWWVATTSTRATSTARPWRAARPGRRSSRSSTPPPSTAAS